MTILNTTTSSSFLYCLTRFPRLRFFTSIWARHSPYIQWSPCMQACCLVFTMYISPSPFPFPLIDPWFNAVLYNIIDEQLSSLWEAGCTFIKSSQKSSNFATIFGHVRIQSYQPLIEPFSANGRFKLLPICTGRLCSRCGIFFVAQ